MAAITKTSSASRRINSHRSKPSSPLGVPSKPLLLSGSAVETGATGPALPPALGTNSTGVGVGRGVGVAPVVAGVGSGRL